MRRECGRLARGIYNVHFKGVFFLTQKLLPLIKDGGRIVNVSTARTRLISPGGAAYGSMKGAVEVLTKYMAKELGPRRIAVNVVAPGARRPSRRHRSYDCIRLSNASFSCAALSGALAL